MQVVEAISMKLNRLPEEKQIEVEDYVDFLLSQLPVDAGRPEGLDIDKVLDETFGIWPDEVDGVEYENRLRRQWRNRIDELSR